MHPLDMYDQLWAYSITTHDKDAAILKNEVTLKQSYNSCSPINVYFYAIQFTHACLTKLGEPATDRTINQNCQAEIGTHADLRQAWKRWNEKTTGTNLLLPST